MCRLYRLQHRLKRCLIIFDTYAFARKQIRTLIFIIIIFKGNIFLLLVCSLCIICSISYYWIKKYTKTTIFLSYYSFFKFLLSSVLYCLFLVLNSKIKMKYKLSKFRNTTYVVLHQRQFKKTCVIVIYIYRSTKRLKNQVANYRY